MLIAVNTLKVINNFKRMTFEIKQITVNQYFTINLPVCLIARNLGIHLKYEALDPLF